MRSADLIETALRWLAPVFLLVVLGVIGLALLGGWLGDRALRRSIDVAAASVCPKCGQSFGRDAILAGKAEYESEFAELAAKHPGVRFRRLARWAIRCPSCAAVSIFEPDHDAWQSPTAAT